MEKQSSNCDELQLVRMSTVLAMVGLSRAEIYRRIHAGTFPGPVPIGERAVAFNVQEIRSWIRARLLERDIAGRVR